MLNLYSHQAFTHLLVNPTSSPSSHSFLKPSIESTRRLRHTRQRLGSHRHNLLVALRVVNRIEKEVFEAEYENWLLGETTKCSRMGELLAEASGQAKVKYVEAWVKDYCGDCEKSLTGVKETRKGLL